MKLGIVLDRNGNTVTSQEKPQWMSQAEALAWERWMKVLEIEYLETAGRGYKATGIVTENSKAKDAILAESHNPQRNIILTNNEVPH